MPKYKVKPEMRHGVSGRYGPGELVELDERSAAAFSDKLELVDQSESEDQPMPAEELIDPRDYLIEHVFRNDDVALLRKNEGSIFITPKTLGDVIDATDDELLSITGLGPKTLERIRADIALEYAELQSLAETKEMIDVDNEI